MPPARHRLRMILIVLCITLALLTVRELWHAPDGKLHLQFLPVRGHSLLITLPHGNHVLIDGSADWSSLTELGTALPFFDRSIDRLILSRLQPNRTGSLAEIIDRYSVNALAVPAVGTDLGAATLLTSRATRRGVLVQALSLGDRIDLGDGATVSVLWPPKNDARVSRDQPNPPLVLVLQYAGHRALLALDLTKPVVSALLASKADLRAELLEVSRTGAKAAAEPAFLRAVDPTSTIISGGSDTPSINEEALSTQLERLGLPAPRTTDTGHSIHIVW